MKNILSIIIIIGSVASFILVIQPKYEEIKSDQAKSDQLRDVLVNARKLQSIRDDLLEKRSKFSSADLSRLSKMVPESVDNVKLILELQRIAGNFDLEIQTAKTDTDEEEAAEGEEEQDQNDVDLVSKDYGIISLDFNLTGSYFNFLRFLNELEMNLRITDIRSVSFTESQTQDYIFNLTLETYWLKDNI